MLRPMWNACSPTWLTQPTITSSIAAGSMPVRSTSASSTAAPRSAGMPVLQRAVALAAGGAHGVDDIGFQPLSPEVSEAS